MPRSSHILFTFLLPLAIHPHSVMAQVSSSDAAKVVHAVALSAESAKEYSFEGSLQILGQRGSDPAKLLSAARVRYAVADPGRYLLRVQPSDKEEYLLVSDGQKSWAYVPKLKQYTEQEAAVITGDEDSDDESDSSAGVSSEERDMAETFARLIGPTLASLGKDLQAVDTKGTVEVKYHGQKQNWPLIRALTTKDGSGTQNLVQLAVDPATSAIGRMIWSSVSRHGGQRTILQVTFDFSDFRMGERLPEDTFTFEPPKKAKLVDAVPIPGQTGSFLLNQPAPDFELKNLDGEKVRLSDLRGHPVLLAFWASWCGPCRRELPSLVKIYSEYKDKGLVVLGVNDEGKGTARKFVDLANLNFPVLDDSGAKAHHLYRVHAIPSAFLIDSDGKVARFFRGGHDEDVFRAALKSVGL